MALVKKNLIIGLSTFLDPESPVFVASPSNIADAAYLWSNALHSYMSLVFPSSPTVIAVSNAARATMYSAMIVALTSQSFNIQLQYIITSYAVTLAAGFAPMYIAIPPVTPLLLSPIFAAAQLGVTSADFINAFATAIDIWMRTGKASLVTPTGTLPPINWF